MADKTIGELPPIENINNNCLIPAEQGGSAGTITGAQIKAWALEALYFRGVQVNPPSGGTSQVASISDSRITSATVVLECIFADPSKVTDIVWESNDNGTISFYGTCTGATTASVTLAKRQNTN